MMGDAVMLEVRPLARIPLVLQNVRSSLPETWRVNFWHGPTNHQRVLQSRELAPARTNGSLRLRRYTLNGSPVGVKLSYLMHDKYMKSFAFWGDRSLDRPLLLLFEPDTALCPPDDWAVRLEELSAYAFVGAPWTRRPPAYCYNLPECVGNSGLSLWRRDVIAAVLAARRIEEYGAIVADFFNTFGFPLRGRHHSHGFQSRIVNHYLSVGNRDTHGKRKGDGEARTHKAIFPAQLGQDILFSHLLQALDYFGLLPVRGVAPEHLAARFSVETSYATNFTPIGIHQAYTYLPSARLHELTRRCPAMQNVAEAVAKEGSRSLANRADKRASGAKMASFVPQCNEAVASRCAGFASVSVVLGGGSTLADQTGSVTTFVSGIASQLRLEMKRKSLMSVVGFTAKGVRALSKPSKRCTTVIYGTEDFKACCCGGGFEETMAALTRARDLLLESDLPRAIVLLTDGDASHLSNPSVDWVARKLRQARIVVHVVAVGNISSTQRELLASLALSASGRSVSIYGATVAEAGQRYLDSAALCATTSTNATLVALSLPPQVQS